MGGILGVFWGGSATPLRILTPLEWAAGFDAGRIKHVWCQDTTLGEFQHALVQSK